MSRKLKCISRDVDANYLIYWEHLAGWVGGYGTYSNYPKFEGNWTESLSYDEVVSIPGEFL